MFGIGGSELLVVAVVAVLFIGPKELPQVMRTAGRVVRRIQYVKFAFTQQFEDFMREQELDELRRSIRGDAEFSTHRKDSEAGDEDSDEGADDDDYHRTVNFEPSLRRREPAPAAPSDKAEGPE